jgi:hypothetical protein
MVIFSMILLVIIYEHNMQQIVKKNAYEYSIRIK